MKVKNMTSTRSGRPVANQFVITHEQLETFQSYDKTIVVIDREHYPDVTITLDATYWNYSVTTGKYRNEFLGEHKDATQAKIDSGEYVLVNLN